MGAHASEKDGRGYPTKTPERGLAVLEFFPAVSEAIAPNVLEAVDLSRSAIYQTLDTLRQRSCLQVNPASGKHRSGVRAAELGMAILKPFSSGLHLRRHMANTPTDTAATRSQDSANEAARVCGRQIRSRGGCGLLQGSGARLRTHAGSSYQCGQTRCQVPFKGRGDRPTRGKDCIGDHPAPRIRRDVGGERVRFF